jgi:chorismate dehydratase
LERKIRVGAVSYLNTKPLVYGFKQGMMADSMELIEDYPSKIAAMLVNDEIDMGLVPVAIIPFLKEYHIVSDYCIACEGEVASVCLFSEVPINEIESIYLDYQSRTSVALLKVLLREHWKMTPQFIAATPDYENSIGGTTAGLVIGDRALKQRLRSKYIYDLGTAWEELTGLPFVFAAWISNKKLPDDFIFDFNRANNLGLQQLNLVIAENHYPYYDLYKYYTENIVFNPKFNKQTCINLFLEKLRQL